MFGAETVSTQKGIAQKPRKRGKQLYTSSHPHRTPTTSEHYATQAPPQAHLHLVLSCMSVLLSPNCYPLWFVGLFRCRFR